MESSVIKVIQRREEWLHKLSEVAVQKTGGGMGARARLCRGKSEGRELLSFKLTILESPNVSFKADCRLSCLKEPETLGNLKCGQGDGEEVLPTLLFAENRVMQPCSAQTMGRTVLTRSLMLVQLDQVGLTWECGSRYQDDSLQGSTKKVMWMA